MVLGEFTQVAATTATRRPQVRNTETDALVVKTCEDQIAVTGTLDSGAVAAIHFRGGDTSTVSAWEIHGSEGNLQITSDTGNLHFGQVDVRGGRAGEPIAEIAVPESYDQYPALSGQPAHAVAHAYAQIQRDLREGTVTSPDFVDATYRHRLLDAIQRSAASGQAAELPLPEPPRGRPPDEGSACCLRLLKLGRGLLEQGNYLPSVLPPEIDHDVVDANLAGSPLAHALSAVRWFPGTPAAPTDTPGTGIDGVLRFRSRLPSSGVNAG